MHRFYVFHPIQMFPYELVAAAALCLGAKAENLLRTSTQVANTLVKLLNRKESPNEQFKSYKEEIEITENFMLMTLEYDFCVSDPKQCFEEACTLFNISNRQLRVLAFDTTLNNRYFQIPTILKAPSNSSHQAGL